MFRSSLKTFTRSSRYLLKYNGLGASFSNYKSIVPFSSTKPAPKDEKTFLMTQKQRSMNMLYSLQPKPGEKVKITFILNDGQKIETEGKVGDTLLDVVVNNDLNIEGYGACEGTLTCSTCHVILKKEDYDRLPEEPCDEERDMLDLAYGLTDTSRLGCQITLSKDLEGLQIQVPETINDARS